jgi:hypothetical protein
VSGLILRGDINKLLWSDKSPDAGHPTCLCSACGKWIAAREEPIIRLFDGGTKLEARFCEDCAHVWLGVVPMPNEALDDWPHHETQQGE